MTITDLVRQTLVDLKKPVVMTEEIVEKLQQEMIYHPEIKNSARLLLKFISQLIEV